MTQTESLEQTPINAAKKIVKKGNVKDITKKSVNDIPKLFDNDTAEIKPKRSYRLNPKARVNRKCKFELKKEIVEYFPNYVRDCLSNDIDEYENLTLQIKQTSFELKPFNILNACIYKFLLQHQDKRETDDLLKENQHVYLYKSLINVYNDIHKQFSKCKNLRESIKDAYELSKSINDSKNIDKHSEESDKNDSA